VGLSVPKKKEHGLEGWLGGEEPTEENRLVGRVVRIACFISSLEYASWAFLCSVISNVFQE
jgi:hypothetical protein